MKDNEQVQEISLSEINLDRETQIRVEVSEETVQRYYEVMIDEATRDLFPPILLFRDPDGRLWLADGHHRVAAAIRRKFASIRAIIRPGTKANAIWEAAKINGRNGLQLLKQDFRRAVVMLVEAWPDRSNVMIADVLGCDEKTVRKHRPKLSTSDGSEVEKRLGKDGKTRTVRKSAKSSVAEPGPKNIPAPNKSAETHTPTEEKAPVPLASPQQQGSENLPDETESMVEKLKTVPLTDRQKSLRDLYPVQTFWGKGFVHDAIAVFPDWYLQHMVIDLFNEHIRRSKDGESILVDYIGTKLDCPSDKKQERMLREILGYLLLDDSVEKVMNVFIQEKQKYAMDDDEEEDESDEGEE